MYQGVLLDVYGTLMHEDDAVLGPICEQVAELAQVAAPVVADLWWLAATMRHLEVADDADRLCQAQFAFWRQPTIFSDSLSFLCQVRQPI